MTILHYAHGDLRTVINELEIEELTSDDSGTKVLKLTQGTYAEYMENQLPQAIENGICDKDVVANEEKVCCNTVYAEISFSRS